MSSKLHLIDFAIAFGLSLLHLIVFAIAFGLSLPVIKRVFYRKTDSAKAKILWMSVTLILSATIGILVVIALIGLEQH